MYATQAKLEIEYKAGDRRCSLTIAYMYATQAKPEIPRQRAAGGQPPVPSVRLRRVWEGERERERERDFITVEVVV